MHRLLLLALLFFTVSVFGQDRSDFGISAAHLEMDSINLLDFAGYLCDSTGRLDFAEVKARQEAFVPLHVPAGRYDMRYVHWFFFRIDSRQAEDTLKRMIRAIPLYLATVYQIQNGGVRIKKLGQTNRPFQGFLGDHNVAILEIPPGEENLFFVSLDNHPRLSRLKFCSFGLSLHSLDSGRETIRRFLLNNLDFKIFTAAFLAILSFLIVFTGLMYMQNKDAVYLHYALYLAAILVYYLARRSYLLHTPFSYLNGWRLYMEIPLSLFMFMGYIHFIRSFLGVNPVQTPRLARTLRGAMNLLLVALAGLIILELIAPLHVSMQVVDWVRSGLLIAGGWVMYRVYQEGGKLSRFILWGTFTLVLGGLLVFMSDQVERHTGYSLQMHPISYSQMGVLAEALIFALGLGYRTRLLREEKIEAELKFLRTQMNPHFIFNSLNSIKDLIQQGQLEESEEYLTKFARLLRGVLSNSEQNLISLEEELELCTYYLRLESLRFDHSFHYEVHADPELLELFIPPLIFQPFLENAIWHGLLPKEGERWVVLRVFTRGDWVVGQIEDNGIGRYQAAKDVDPEKKDSFGIRLAQERLRRQLHHAGVHYSDKFNNFGEPDGTIVEVVMNLKHLNLEVNKSHFGR